MPQNKDAVIIPEVYERTFAPGTYAEEKDDKGTITQRRVRAIIASDNPVEVYDWQNDEIIREVLTMDGMKLPENRQVPLLDNHSRYGSSAVKGSVRNISMGSNGTAEGDVFFSSTAVDIATLAREGHLTDLSVGYKTDKSETVWLKPNERCTVRGKEYVNNTNQRCAIRTVWYPFEVSTTPIGADARAKFRAAHLDNNQPQKRRDAMLDKNENGQQENTASAEKVNVEQIRAAAAKEGAEAERARSQEIEGAAREMNIPEEFYRELITKGISAAEGIRKLIAEAQRLLKASKTIQTEGPNVTHDEADKFRDAALNGMLVRNGFQDTTNRKRLDDKTVSEVEKTDFRDGSAITMAKKCLERAGVRNAPYLNNVEIARMVMNPGEFGRGSVAQATGDFAYILAAAVNKFLMKGYEEIPTTYDKWVGKQPLNDFKENKLVNLSNFSDIDWVPEGKNPEWGRFSDKAELITLYKYMKAYSLSFEALVNDDKNAFSRIPAALGGAVARKKERTTYNYLYRGNTEGTGSGAVGPTMNEDSLAMFHSTHANLGTTAAPSTASLSEARKLLRSIKLLAPDATSKTQYTLAPIKFIITGETKWTEWQKVLGSPAAYLAADGSTQQANAGIINPYATMGIQLITTPYLDEYSTTVWYAAADSNVAQHLVLATLAGEEAPQIRSAPSEIGQARGIVWDLMVIFVIGSSDWRGIVKNAGA
jgi:hypothetical protein